MAEAMLKHLQGSRLYVDSVGVRRAPIDPFAVTVMAELGLHLERHRAKTFDDLEDLSFDLVISLSPEAHHGAVELTRTMDCEVEYWPSADPTSSEGTRDMRLDAYREVRDQLWARILARFPLIQGPSG